MFVFVLNSFLGVFTIIKVSRSSHKVPLHVSSVLLCLHYNYFIFDCILGEK